MTQSHWPLLLCVAKYYFLKGLEDPPRILEEVWTFQGFWKTVKLFQGTNKASSIGPIKDQQGLLLLLTDDTHAEGKRFKLLLYNYLLNLEH